MFIPGSPYTKIAYERLCWYFDKNHNTTIRDGDIPEELYQQRLACFVSLHMLKDGELRGCIGTLEPQEKNLVLEIERNAIAAATRDYRFKALKKSELSRIEISVDVLSAPERVFSRNDLDPEIYGLILKDSAGHRGVLLPGLSGVDSVEDQIDIVKRKAGIEYVPDEQISMFRFTSSRYF